MENESIRLEFNAKGGSPGGGDFLSDNRQFTVQGTRAKVSAFMDRVCEMIEEEFEQ